MYEDGEVQDNDELEEIDILFPIRRPYHVHNRFHHRDIFNYWDDIDFVRRYRLSKDSVQHILNIIGGRLQHIYNRNNPIPPLLQILLALRFYSSGSFYITVGDYGNIHKSTVAKIIWRVTRAIVTQRAVFIKLPTTAQEKSMVMQHFYDIARFPRILGAIDGTHIRLFQSPGGPNAELFRNRKGYFSINVQIISCANHYITDVVARWPGSAHDSNIFDHSQVRMKFENEEMGDCLLLGDSGYPLRAYILTPLDNPVTEAENLYNESHIRTRNVVERTFGIWKRRFPILSIGMRCKIPLVQDIIVATCILHNLALRNDDRLLENIDGIEYDQGFLQIDPGANPNANNAIRMAIIDYFRNL